MQKKTKLKYYFFKSTVILNVEQPFTIFSKHCPCCFVPEASFIGYNYTGLALLMNSDLYDGSPCFVDSSALKFLLINH